MWVAVCSVNVLFVPCSKRPPSGYCRPPTLPSAVEKSACSEGFRNIGGRGGRGGQQKTQLWQARKNMPHQATTLGMGDGKIRNLSTAENCVPTQIPMLIKTY